MKKRPLSLALVFFAIVAWAFVEIVQVADPIIKTLYVLLITAFLPLASKFLNQSEALGDLGGVKATGKGKSYPCSECGTPFEAIAYDDLYRIASRTQGEYEHQISIKYKCRKCKFENLIYWSRDEPFVAFA